MRPWYYPAAVADCKIPELHSVEVGGRTVALVKELRYKQLEEQIDKMLEEQPVVVAVVVGVVGTEVAAGKAQVGVEEEVGTEAVGIEVVAGPVMVALAGTGPVEELGYTTAGSAERELKRNRSVADRTG